MSVALLAAFIWLLSLPFMAYTGYSPTSGYAGFMVLLFGWGVHEAWYANVLFFLAFLMMAAGRSVGTAFFTYVISAVSIGLSLSFTTLTRAPELNAVCGFGFGAVIWLAAIQVMFLAAAMRLTEAMRVDRATVVRRLPLAVATLAFVVLTGGVGWIAVSQRNLAIGEDLDMLRAHTIVKLTPLCRDLVELRRLSRAEGPVEIEESVHSPSTHSYVLNLTRLHAAGIDVSRYMQMDLRATDKTGLVYSMQAAEGLPAVLVRIDSTPPPRDTGRSFDMFRRHEGVRVTVRESGGATHAARWEHERGSAYCPRLHVKGSVASTVEQFVVEALRRDRPKMDETPAEADIKKFQMLEVPIVRQRSSSESRVVAVDTSCRERFVEAASGGLPSKAIATRYRLWGPFRSASSTMDVFFDLGRLGFPQVRVVCNHDRMALVGLQRGGGDVHAISLSLKDMTVLKWVRFGQPEMHRGYRPTWFFGTVALEGMALRMELVNEAQGRKAEILLGL
jgi:hypothetical protein